MKRCANIDGSAWQRQLNRIRKNLLLCTNGAMRQNLAFVRVQGAHIWRPEIIVKRNPKVGLQEVMRRMEP